MFGIFKKVYFHLSVNKKSVILFLFQACLILSFCSKKIDLLKLERLTRELTTTQDTLDVVRKLEQYYLYQPIPDSIAQQVEIEFRQLKQRKQSPEISNAQENHLSQEIFSTEKKIRSIIQAALLARIRADESQSQILLENANKLAAHIDSARGEQYWQEWLKGVRKFDLNQAQNWLRAQIAANYCYEFHNHTNTYQKAEAFGTMALHLLASLNDPRLQLDIWQRIQLILYKFKGLYGLSFALAEVKIKEARRIHYVLREIGLIYNLANALGHVGQDQIAISKLETLLKQLQNFPTVHEMIIYKKLISFSLSSAYWQTCNYLQALQVCKELEKEALNPQEKMDLEICEGLNYNELGEYERVEHIYQNTLRIAKNEQNFPNLVVIYCNLADYYNQFGLNKKALLYCDSAITILERKNHQNIATKCMVLQMKSSILLSLGHEEEIEHLSEEINKLLDDTNIPIFKAENFRLMARNYFQLKKYNTALEYFTKAWQIYKELHLTRPALETQINLIKTYIQVTSLDKAQIFLNEVFTNSEKMKDELILIEANGLQAEIAFKTGNIQKAIHFSNLVLSRVRNRFHLIQNLENFASFRQRVYNYLKKAAVYEIYAQRIDSAFCKLDFAKNSYFDMKLNVSDTIHPRGNLRTKLIAIDEVQKRIMPDQLLLNFLILDDELHVFALNREGLKLFSRSIPIEVMKNLIDDYLESIMNTDRFIQKSQKDELLEYYQNVNKSGNKLYQFLFGWPQLATLIENAQITYIIPDEKLYKLPLATLPLSESISSEFLTHKTALINLPCAAAVPEKENGQDLPAGLFKIKYSADLNFKKAGELIHAIKSIFPNSKELSSHQTRITKDEILQQLNQGDDVYIFCGHGAANSQNPELSTLTLDIFNTTLAEKQLFQVTVNDFKKIDWSSAKLVILLGCETAGRDELLGTGLEGFQQVISNRGAQNVIATLWKIEENQGISQIKSFLEIWIKTHEVAVAFHTMQITAIQKLENHKLFQKPHPFLWGAFTLTQATTHIKP